MSLTIQGWIVGVLLFVVSQAGLPFTEAEINTTVQVLGGLISAGMVYYGRYRQGDIDFLGRKRDN